ncbi:MAG: 16S rRNA (uracil(1498)-N(3))-methyltransferase [Chitinophagaceae bacterium]|nr:16S rRNA (uracil(1498)-N(3))-methyltransferase [Chitinophagaceae bacterium]
MPFPFFYSEEIASPGAIVALDETTSRHVMQVLRMQKGDQLYLTNGKGKKLLASVHEQNKKRCTIYVREETDVVPPGQQNTIAVSLLKNASRFEWFLEKATEIGITAIIPLICERTERTNFRTDRMNNILVSAMLQSRQCWLPCMPEPVQYRQWIAGSTGDVRLIAHCMEAEKKVLSQQAVAPGSKTICIGPEGDFTPGEVELALQHGFKAVSLGNTRLRTETAAIAAAVLLAIQ